MRPHAVLLTRPRPDSEESAAALAARGIETVIAPLLDIAIRDETPSLTGIQALLITSANGIRAFAQHSQRRDVPVFAVGDASAGAARALGFAAVESAAGDVGDLAALVRRRLRPQAGRLLHPAGSAVAGDLAAHLSRSGFAVRRYVAYAARSARELPVEARLALAEGSISAVLLYSPRTATIFRDLVVRAGRAADCRFIEALCLSAAVAEALAPLAFLEIRVAERPEQESLFALLPQAGELSA
jgi:uroporphyrinogen-III synthase